MTDPANNRIYTLTIQSVVFSSVLQGFNFNFSCPYSEKVLGELLA